MSDLFPVRQIDYLEFYVGNAKQSMQYFVKSFGFKPVAYAGLETGSRDKVSYVLEGKGMVFVISGALNPEHEIAEFVHLHGDGVKDVALRVDDVETAYRGAIERGGIAIMEPQTFTDEYGTFKKAIIGTYGDTVHTLIERKAYKGNFAPGYKSYHLDLAIPNTGLIGIDHIVGNVEEMEEWVSYYEKVFGFAELQQFTDDDINTEYSALMSKVMQDGTGKIKFPINEPATGKRKSQIQEYLEFYRGAGVQHVALLTSDILTTVTQLKLAGVEFLSTPGSYYDELHSWVGDIDEDMDRIRDLNILVDRDEEGYLLQIFTKPLVDRPTLFFEIIQRKGSRGFGAGNFKALFEAIEREQEKRGNL